MAAVGERLRCDGAFWTLTVYAVQHGRRTPEQVRCVLDRAGLVGLDGAFLAPVPAMTGFMLAVLLGLVLTASLLLAGVAALPAILVLAVLVGGVYLFTHTRRA